SEYPGEELTLMGSSLGGFYAQFLAAALDAVDRVVMINPALQPQLTLKPF
ncbi:MAG: esterase, partial [Gammaproteobacteria bacterium]|nr:esterase [Gammaproteobacteria bacterium]